ncbi:hypothetical protein D3C81_1250990 [compost metagenome]
MNTLFSRLSAAVSRDADDFHAALYQFETVIAQVLDAITNGQLVGGHECGDSAIGVLLGFLELMHRINPAFGIPCMKLSDEYCSHLI